MEENQDALLNYQLLEFRHEIMLSYMKSKEMEDLHNAYAMLEYYFYFFNHSKYLESMLSRLCVVNLL